MRRQYEFAINGDNNIFGQDETDRSLAIGSIREAQQALNRMATDYFEWFDADDLPKCVVVLRRQSDHRFVAEFKPYVRRRPTGTVEVKWTRVTAPWGLMPRESAHVVNGEWGGYSVRQTKTGYLVEYWSRVQGHRNGERRLLPFSAQAPKGLDVASYDPHYPAFAHGADRIADLARQHESAKLLRQGEIVK